MDSKLSDDIQLCEEPLNRGDSSNLLYFIDGLNKKELPTIEPENNVGEKGEDSEVDGKKFQCYICNKTLCSQGSLTRHLKNHPKGKKFECDQCNKKFSHINVFRQHKKYHSDGNLYKCPVCSKSYGSKASLTYHVSIHSKERSFECSVCQKTFLRSNDLKQHVKRIHTMPKTFTCSDCNQSFPDRHDLKFHKNTECIHSDRLKRKLIECDICKETFNTSEDLEEHEIIHAGEYKCDSCNKMFISNESLKKHEKSHAKKQFKCNTCDEHFFSRRDLTIHKYEHTGEKVFECEKCHRKYGSVTTLRKHNQVPCTIQCPLCQEEFLDTDQLSLHKEMHPEPEFSELIDKIIDEQKSRNKVMCDICGKSLSSVNSLKSHKLIHDVDNHFKCDECDMKFVTTRQLKYHKNFHSGRRPYECDICGKKYYHPSSLGSHKKEHSDQPLFKCNICYEMLFNKRELRLHKKTHVDGHEHSYAEIHVKTVACDICGKRFRNVEHLETHKLTHYRKKSYACKKCDIHFNTYRQLRYHRNLHNGVKPYECDICHEKFYNPKSLNTHKKTHTQPPLPEPVIRKTSQSEAARTDITQEQCDNPVEELSDHGQKEVLQDQDIFKCSICGMGFDKGGKLLDHEKTHSNGDGKNVCIICNEEFSTLDLLNSHYTNNHHGLMVLHCSTCEKDFSNLSDYQKHITDCGKIFVCDTCGEEFSDSGKYESHKATHVTLVYHKCTICNKIFNSIGDFNRHSITHMKEITFNCDTCNQDFTTYKSLRLHKKLHCNSNCFVCDVCKKQFDCLDDLNKHKSAHTKQVTFNCDTCNQKFLSSESIKLHMSSHCEKVLYRCHICDDTFPSLSDVVQHMTTHAERKDIAGTTEFLKLNEVLFKCDSCDEIFTSLSDLNQHKLTRTEQSASDNCERDSPKRIPLGGYTCDVCDEEFSLLSDFDQHIQSHITEDSSPSNTSGITEIYKEKAFALLRCDICDTLFEHEGLLLDHKQMHLNGGKDCQPNQLDANQGFKKFKRRSRKSAKLQEHASNANGQVSAEKPMVFFKCTLCKTVLPSLAALNNHKSLHVKCEDCDLEFANERRLKIHRNDIHGEREGSEENDSCESITSALHDDEEENMNQQSVNCDICGKIFANVSSLDFHKTIHTLFPLFKCDNCQQKFKNMQDLNEHKTNCEYDVPENAIMETGGTELASESSDHGNIESASEETTKCAVCLEVFSEKCLSHTITNEREIRKKSKMNNKKVRKSKQIYNTNKTTLETEKDRSEDSKHFNSKSTVSSPAHDETVKDCTKDVESTVRLCDKSFTRKAGLDVHKDSHVSSKSP